MRKLTLMGCLVLSAGMSSLWAGPVETGAETSLLKITYYYLPG